MITHLTERFLKLRRRDQPHVVQLLEHPKRSMAVQIEALSELAAPEVVDDHGRSVLRCLYHGLHFASVLHAPAISLREKNIYRALVITVASLEKRVLLKDRLQTILRGSTIEELPSDSLRNQHAREQDAEFRHQSNMVESDDTRTVNG